ncbi:MAG: TonB-dependent receptor, partial [Bacteroidota bacterium]
KASQFPLLTQTLLSSRLMMEGPIKKGKHSFMLAVRRSYPDIFLDLFDSDDGGNKVRFLDFNGKINFILDNKNRLYFSTYRGVDVFRFFDAYENKWGNETATLRWNHLFSDRLFANFSAIYSNYSYSIENFIQGVQTLNWESGVRDINLKADFTLYLNSFNRLNFGFQNVFHRFVPGKEKNNRIQPVPPRNTLEQAFYFGHYLKKKRWQADVGIRISAAHNFGKSLIYTFDENFQLMDSTRTSGGIYHSKWNILPRLSLSYSLDNTLLLNFGYSHTVQYLQELRNSISGFNAFFTFFPSGVNIPEQRSRQVSLGINKAFRRSNTSFGAEIYYRWLENQVDFEPHSQIIQNPLVERELRIGKGYAYGIEFFLKKETATWTGSLAYTYARTFRKIKEINNGEKYPTYYDQPHAVNLLFLLKKHPRWDFSINWQLRSGNTLTLPIGSYQYDNTVVPIYGNRNDQRLPAFHRLDLSATLFPKGKAKSYQHSYWTFSLYNTYFRKNTLSIDILPIKEKGTDNIPNPTNVGAFKTYVLRIIPSVGYHFKL